MGQMNKRGIWKLAQAMVDVIDANDAGDKPVMVDTPEGGYMRIKRTPAFHKVFTELKLYLDSHADNKTNL